MCPTCQYLTKKNDPCWREVKSLFRIWKLHNPNKNVMFGQLILRVLVGRMMKHNLSTLNAQYYGSVSKFLNFSDKNGSYRTYYQPHFPRVVYFNYKSILNRNK